MTQEEIAMIWLKAKQEADEQIAANREKRLKEQEEFNAKHQKSAEIERSNDND